MPGRLVRSLIRRLVHRAGGAGARLLALAALLCVAAAPFACGYLGEPAFTSDDGAVLPPLPTTTEPPFDANEDTGPPSVTLRGRVVPPLPALVAIELGGLNRIPPAAETETGAIRPTLQVDPFYTLGTKTEEGGVFSLSVPDEKIGVHVYASGYYCGVPEAGAIEPGTGNISVSPHPLTAGEGGALPPKPIISEFTVTPLAILPGESLTMAAVVTAQDPDHDPLSAQVLAIQPETSWAGVFSPPTPGTWGKGYPNGVYSRLVVGPTTPGTYVYYLVAATEACVVSEPATASVVVSLTGEGGIEDASEEPEDARKDVTDDVRDDLPADATKDSRAD
jgi:hypothetical protein